MASTLNSGSPGSTSSILHLHICIYMCVYIYCLEDLYFYKFLAESRVLDIVEMKRPRAWLGKGKIQVFNGGKGIRVITIGFLKLCKLCRKIF